MVVRNDLGKLEVHETLVAPSERLRRAFGSGFGIFLGEW
jgi:hypothetical protein